MSDLVRLSMSLERPLYERLEQLVDEIGAHNRSEFIRDLLRTHLAIREWAGDGDVLGTVTLVYDHHVRGLSEKLVTLQHDSTAQVIAATHIHLDHQRCLEVLIARGRARSIHVLTENLRQLKGVFQVSVSLVSSGSNTMP